MKSQSEGATVKHTATDKFADVEPQGRYYLEPYGYWFASTTEDCNCRTRVLNDSVRRSRVLFDSICFIHLLFSHSRSQSTKFFASMCR